MKCELCGESIDKGKTYFNVENKNGVLKYEGRRVSNKAEIAYWIKKENIDSYWFICSKCGKESGFSPVTPEYCPHCHRKINGIMYEDGTIVSRYQALEYWKKRYNQEKNYYDEHWNEEERYQYKFYIDAMKRAIEALENI